MERSKYIRENLKIIRREIDKTRIAAAVANPVLYGKLHKWGVFIGDILRDLDIQEAEQEAEIDKILESIEKLNAYTTTNWTYKILK